MPEPSRYAQDHEPPAVPVRPGQLNDRDSQAVSISPPWATDRGQGPADQRLSHPAAPGRHTSE